MTSLIKLLDQNAIRLTKTQQEKSRHIVTLNKDDLSACLKHVDLQTAVSMLHNAWEKVSAEVIIKCWKKIVLDDLEKTQEYHD